MKSKIITALKLIARTFIIAIPVAILVLAYICNFILTGTRQVVYKILKQHNYWDLENEWFQFRQDLDHWYLLWRYGRNKDDF